MPRGRPISPRRRASPAAWRRRRAKQGLQPAPMSTMPVRSKGCGGRAGRTRIGPAPCRGASGGTAPRGGSDLPAGGRRRPRRPAPGAPPPSPRHAPWSSGRVRRGCGRRRTTCRPPGAGVPPTGRAAPAPRRTRVADVVEDAVGRVQAEKEGGDRLDLQVLPVPAHDAVDGAGFDLDPAALAAPVRRGPGLATTPSQPAPSYSSNHEAATSGSAVCGVRATCRLGATSAWSRRALSSSGSPRRSASPEPSRSKAMKVAASRPPAAAPGSRRDAGAAGGRRSRARGAPRSRLSVDDRALREGPSERVEQLGEVALEGRLFRLSRRSVSPSRKTMQRRPSTWVRRPVPGPWDLGLGPAEHGFERRLGERHETEWSGRPARNSGSRVPCGRRARRGG